MDARDLLLMQHAGVHAGAVSGARRPTLADRTFAQISDAEARRRPTPGTNSAAWLLWHIARSEDAIVNLVLFGQAQVLDEGWRRRLRVERSDIGTGMIADEVAALSEAIDLAVLRDYRDAVGRRTRETVQAMPASAWDGRVSVEDLRRATAAGAFGRAADTIEQYFVGWPRPLALAALSVVHSAQHMGEAQTVLSLLGPGA